MLEPSEHHDQFKQSVCENLNTSLDQFQGDVETLKQWLRTQFPDIKCPDDNRLSAYLLSCTNRLERTKQKISNFYRVQPEIPEFFEQRDLCDKHLQQVYTEMPIIYLPKLTPDGNRALMLKLVTGNPEHFDVPVLVNRFLAQIHIQTRLEPFNNGCYLLYDSSNFSMSHILKCSPIVLKKAFYLGQEVIPINFTKIIMFNAPKALNIVMKVVKPFVTSKFYEKIAVRTEGVEILGQYLPIEMLPKDYGGLEVSTEELNEKWIRYLKAERDRDDGMILIKHNDEADKKQVTSISRKPAKKINPN